VIDRALARRPAVVRLRAAVEAPRAVLLAVAGLILVALTARIVLARDVLAPWVMPDELEYSELAKSFEAGGNYLFRDHAFALRTIYPALISPAWAADSMSTTYGVAKALNVAMMTAAAIPLYLWARRLVSPLWSVLAVVLFLAMPSFVYTGEILTENAYLPAVVLALFALALALERPTLPRQLLALALAGLAAAVRVQGLVFGLIVVSAICLKVFFDLRAARPESRREALRDAARAWWPTAAALIVVAVAYLAYKAAQGASLSSGLGTAGGVASADYSVRDASRWVVYHFAELAFSVGVIPFSALIVLVGLACRRTTAPTSAERAFLAATIPAVFWTVVQAGLFASRFSLRIEERYMFNVAPVLLLAVVVWLARGLARPPALTAAAALVPGALLLAVPYTNFLNPSMFNATFALIPVWRLTTRLGNTVEPEVFVALGMLAAGLLFASVPRKAAQWVIPAALFAFLTISSASVYATVKFQAAAARYAGGLAGDPSWIDHTIGRDARAAFVYTTDLDSDPHVLWQSEFWNRSVRRVFDVTSHDPSIPDVSAPLDPATGRVKPSLPAGSPELHPRYAVAARGVDVDGTQLAQAGALVLYRVRQPLRLASSIEGVQPDGWIGSIGAYNRYASTGRGRVRVDVVVSREGFTGPPPARVNIVVGRVKPGSGAASIGAVSATRTWTLRDGRARQFSLPAPPPPFRVEVRVARTFSPSQFGSTDTRQLGARVAFAVRRG
jgi:hypothetical protein